MSPSATNTSEIPTILGLPWNTPTFDCAVSNVTPTMHTTSYPAINPALNPLISQAGKTVLITGSTAGIGLAMAKSFVTASASKVIITGRRQERLDKAVDSLRQHAKEIGNHQTKVVGDKFDATKMEEIDAFWTKLGDEGVVVDVLILNAVGDMAMGGLWQGQAEVPPQHLHRFCHVSHPEYSPVLAAASEYGFTKATAGLFFGYIAQQVDPDKLQVVNFHPGTIYSELWQYGLGVDKNLLPFDDISLPADFAVWATTKEARFIHGRFFWAHWDVDEMKALYAERFEKDKDLFRFGVCGLAGSNLHVIQ
ncbi:hypothetical protein QBC45DRAFT_439108 [Copromyces sp. CBS 386.78]|nr:hypothetical protein QBC45DRAFT_439108 [Copromyces sp. CBS 386.78]